MDTHSNVLNANDRRYILLCSKAVELQKLKIGKVSGGEYLYIEDTVGLALYWVLQKQIVFNSIPEPYKDFVWIPLGRELRKIIKQRDRGMAYSPKLYINLANAFLIEYVEKYNKQPKIMEEMWLMILMKENYNKEWNEEKQNWEEIKQL